jgi:hypothetical protein
MILGRALPQKREKNMPGISWEHLTELRRQIEENYKMDMTALERIARYLNGPPAAASPSAYAPGSNAVQAGPSRAMLEPPAPPAPAPTSAEPEQQVSDELTGSLRALFSAHYK